jgi:UDP-N-acetylmuramate--alanine ligase
MYTKNLHIHFVGIGGIGMSGIATILKQQGYTISGCDPNIHQNTITQLQSLGCPVYHGNNAHACDDVTIDILVYIPMYINTIPAIMAEVERARARGIPTISRACMLNELMRTKYSIAVAGSHGKTTTTSLIAHVLKEAHLDPTIIVGGHIKNINSNVHLGTGNFLVAEADESDRSFLELHPTLAVITAIDKEHLETYTDLCDIKDSFAQFINQLPFYGKAIVCIDDENIRSLLPINNIPTISYGIHHPADFSARDIILYENYSTFNVYHHNITQLGSVMLPIPGMHNVYNALGAIALAQELAIDFATIAQSLASFDGVERRFSFCGTYKGAELFDDYAHHPKEIECALRVARKRARHKLTVIFQPHRYTRTQKLWADFLTVFATNPIDTLIITDIYSAGEYSIPTISSERLVQELQALNPTCTIRYVPFDEQFTQLKQAINASIAHNDLLLFLGAGKMDKIAHELAE